MIDRLIESVAPQTALKRKRARMALKAMRSYDSASHSGRAKRLVKSARATSANAALEYNVYELAYRSRDLRRNNPYAEAAIRIMSDLSVGDGIIPAPNTGDKALDDKIKKLFDIWCEDLDSNGHCDFYGMQKLAAEAILESGSVIVRKMPQSSKKGMKIPLKLKLLEIDYLNDYISVASKDDTGNSIYNGIEVNSDDEVVAFHLFKKNPNDSYSLSNQSRISNRISANDVTMSFIKKRPGQLIGAPILTPVILSLNDLSDYEDAELMRKKVEACFTAFVTTAEPDDKNVGEVQDSYGDDGELIEKVSPGTIHYLDHGESVQFGSPHQTGGYDNFIKTHLMKIATGVGMHYSTLSGDLADVNYSSYRAGDIPFKSNIKAFRKYTLIQMFCRPTWKWFIDFCIASGEIRPSNDVNINIYGVKWTPPGFISIDPVTDATADNMNIRMRKKSIDDVIMEEGGDPDKVLENSAKSLEKLNKLGLVSDAEPSHMSRSGDPIILPSDESDQNGDNRNDNKNS